MVAIVMLLAVLLGSAPQVPDRAGQSPQDLADAAEADFTFGRLEDALAKYDRLAALVPDVAPYLWQRGIALYELGRYDACAAQFASFHRVDRRDLENATWHFLCSARASTPKAALEGVLAAGPDPRVLRTEIHEMVLGRMSPDELMALANTSVPLVRFYAHLYVGYYLEATGRSAAALEHFTAAASEEFSGEGGFLNVVARVHLARLGRRALGPNSTRSN